MRPRLAVPSAILNNSGDPMDISINLLPQEDRIKLRQSKLNSRVLFYCVILVAIVAAAIVFLFVYHSTQENNLQYTEDQIQSVKDNMTKYKDVSDNAKIIAATLQNINTLKTKNVDWNSFLTEFNGLVPQEIQISSLKASQQPTATIEISGSSSTRRDALVFLDKLKNTPRFKNTALKSIAKSASNTANSVTFSITADIVWGTK